MGKRQSQESAVETSGKRYRPSSDFVAMQAKSVLDTHETGKELWLIRMPVEMNTSDIDGVQVKIDTSVVEGVVGSGKDGAGYSFDLMSDHSSLANQLYALSPVDDGSLVPTKIHRHVSILPEIDWGSGTVVQQPAPTLSPAPAPLKEKKHKKKDKATKSSKEQPIKEEPDGGIDTPKLEENLKKKKKRSMEGPRDASTVKEAKPPKAEKKKHKASIP